MSEFDLIKRLQNLVNPGNEGASRPCVLGIGDDCAVLEIPANRQLVVTCDTLVEGVHFAAGADALDLGHKALAVNLSDLAAMGAEPGWFFLALTLPQPDTNWLDSFSDGLGSLARAAGITLAGGDMTSGPLSITITAMGLVEAGQALARAGARDGDLVVVSGCLGDAAHALELLAAGGSPRDDCRAALDRPEPRLQLGRQLSGLATSCIDLSDGLAADLGHILDASGVGAQIRLDRLPASAKLKTLTDKARWNLQIAGGDDYELCFTIPASRENELDRLSHQGHCPLTVIGKIIASGGLSWTAPDGQTFMPSRQAYDHFPEQKRGEP